MLIITLPILVHVFIDFPLLAFASLETVAQLLLPSSPYTLNSSVSRHISMHQQNVGDIFPAWQDRLTGYFTLKQTECDFILRAVLGTAWKWVITFTFLWKYDLSASRIASTGPPEERAMVQFQFSVGDKVKLRSKVVYLIFSSSLNLSLNFCLSVYIAVFITHQFLCITCEFHVFCFYYVNIIINKLIYK